MQKFVSAAIVAAALAHTVPAHAHEGFYAGLTTGASKARIKAGSGELLSSSNRPVPLKAFVGFDLNPHFAIEAGYKDTTSKHTFDKEAFGTASAPQLDASVAYLAAKGTIPVGQSVELSGKVGVSRKRYALTGAGADNFALTSVTPMLGIGAAYKVNEKVALVLEMENFGATKEKGRKLVHRSLQAGVKYSF